MTSVALVHSGKSFMPEIDAYINYFQQTGFTASSFVHPSPSVLKTYDILWFFMGIQMPFHSFHKNKFIVHEYCSASTPPFATLKDAIKKTINPTPDLRISLAAEHRGTAFPADSVPFIIRKQGVHRCFYERFPQQKDFDFIYTGSALKSRNTAKWLHKYIQSFPGARIMLVGNHDASIVRQFGSNSNIHFKAAVPVTSLPALLARAHYAVNHVPDMYPYNIQPSTKLQEYCAAGCNIISNNYSWVKRFSQKRQAGIFFVEEDFSNLTPTNLEQFNFTSADMQAYQWDAVFQEMQLHNYIPK